MPDTVDHDTFLSPFTWRYGSEGMRGLWSLAHQRRLWRRIWVALAEAQQSVGLVSAEAVADLRAHQHEIDIPRALEIESQIHHDLMAEIHCYAEQCRVGGGVIHLGATSADIEDNADALRLRDGLDLLLPHLESLLNTLVDLIEREADHVCMAFTHLQPAEPTTVGYRLAGYAQDLLADYEALKRVRGQVRGKGFKGAVGTAASYRELLGDLISPQAFEARIMAALGLEAFTAASQVYPRRQDWEVVSALAGLGLSVYRLAFDLRLLQSPSFGGEWSEPFGRSQVGSSAMPFKRNPINAENLDSLARLLASLPGVAWDNAAHSLLERTLDDSANRRVILPQAFLIADELLLRAGRVLGGLRVDAAAIRRNLDVYGVFAASERLLMEAARRGGDRQVLHEIIRQHSLAAWEALRTGAPNPLADLLSSDERITSLVEPGRVRELLKAEGHIGDAPERARQVAARAREMLAVG